ncbi:MAG: hypothetical protein WCA82_14005 [Jiangellales bacterium]
MEFPMFRRLLDTVSLTGAQWDAVLALSLIAPIAVALDKVMQVRRPSRAV